MILSDPDESELRDSKIIDDRLKRFFDLGEGGKIVAWQDCHRWRVPESRAANPDQGRLRSRPLIGSDPTAAADLAIAAAALEISRPREHRPRLLSPPPRVASSHRRSPSFHPINNYTSALKLPPTTSQYDWT